MEAVRVISLALALASLPTTGAQVTPEHLWPLGSETLAYDVMTGSDATYPSLSTCMTYADGEPSLGYSALDMNGTANKAYVEVQIPTGALPGSFSLGLSIFSPSSPSGPLFSYVADPAHNQGLTEVKVTVGYTSALTYKYEMSSSMGSGSSSNTGSYTPASSTWTRYTLTVDTATGRLAFYSGTNTVFEKASNKQGLKLATPGTLRFARDESSYLVARVTCASLHAQCLQGAELTDAINACALPGASWAHHPPRPPCTPDAPTTTTEPTTTAAPPSPAHVVALNNVTFAYDVIGYHAPAYVTTARCTRLAPGHPSLPLSQATLFDGSMLSVPTLPVAMATFQGDFTLSLYVQPNGTTRGVLWEVTDQGQISGINRIQLELDGLSLTLKVHDVTSGLCGNLLLSNAVTSGSWELVTAQREAATGTIQLTLGAGSPASASDSCVHDSSTSAPGSLLIGGDGSRDGCIRATLQCLTVFTSLVDVTSDVVEDTCNAAISQDPIVIVSEDCLKRSETRIQSSSISARNQIPTGNYGPLTEVTSRSARACAILCLDSDTCRSYVTVRSASGPGVECKLYDFVTSVQFSHLSGAKYFVQIY